MKIGNYVELKNGQKHEIEYGDVFDFDFNSLKLTSFEGSNFGRSIFENPPDEIRLYIGRNKFGYFKGKIDYIKNEEVFDSFDFQEHSFLRYILEKKHYHL